MKALPLAVALLLAGCKDRSRYEPPAAGSAAAAPGSGVPGTDDLCRRGIEAIDRSTCGSAAVDLRTARSSLDAIAGSIQKLGGTDPHTYAIMCSRLLDAIDRDATKAHCTLSLDPAARAHMAEVLDAYYGQRTAVTPTGDAAADAVIAKVAAMRDAACACRDAACLDRADDQLVKIAAMPATAPAAARELTGKLLDDAARCAQRVRSAP